MELNLHRLWAFMQVVEGGGFSAAAHQLFMSQPSPLTSRPISVVHRRDRLLSLAERAFTELLRDVHDWPSQLPHEHDELG